MVGGQGHRRICIDSGVHQERHDRLLPRQGGGDDGEKKYVSRGDSFFTSIFYFFIVDNEREDGQ